MDPVIPGDIREQIMEIYDLPEDLREQWRASWRRIERHCLPDCDRLDGHDGREAGACMHGGAVLVPGPLDLEHGHPDIPVFTPVRDTGILLYDMVLPKWPDGPPWTPFRNNLPRASGCYRLASGARVHVKPGCCC